MRIEKGALMRGWSPGIAFALIFALCGAARASLGRIPVDVVTVGSELYFVLEQPYEIGFVQVSLAPEKGKRRRPMDPVKALWWLGYDLSTEVKDRKYLKLKQIKYGHKYPGFSRVGKPEKLQRNVEYVIEINIAGKFAADRFFIDKNNKAIMPDPVFERQKGRDYSVSKDKDGNITLVASPASK